MELMLDRRFAAVVALLDSDKEGERRSALETANRLLGKAGLKWRDLLVEPAQKRPELAGHGAHQKFCRDALGDMEVLSLMTDWEFDFLTSIRGRDCLTEKQAASFVRTKERLKRVYESRRRH